jgi:hypothetical protein
MRKLKLSRPNRNTSTISILTSKKGAKLTWMLNALRREYPVAEIRVYRAYDPDDVQAWLKCRKMGEVA